MAAGTPPSPWLSLTLNTVTVQPYTTLPDSELSSIREALYGKKNMSLWCLWGYSNMGKFHANNFIIEYVFVLYLESPACQNICLLISCVRKLIGSMAVQNNTSYNNILMPRTCVGLVFFFFFFNYFCVVATFCYTVLLGYICA